MHRVVVTHRSRTCVQCNEPLHVHAWMQLMDDERLRCLSCARLEHLEFVAPGDAALTRRAKRESKVFAIVLEWSKRRRRYEHRGILVEASALQRAEYACLLDRDARARRRTVVQDSYVLAFAARIRAAFPNCPPKREHVIAEHACARGTRRVGRTAMAKTFDVESIRLAVRAHVRHEETRYDALLAAGKPVGIARHEVQSEIDAVLARWRGQ